MYKKEIDQFFVDNTVKDASIPSTAAIAHFNLKLASNPEVGDKAHNMIHEMVFAESPERKEEAAQGLERIAAANTSEQIIKIMRGDVDIINRPDLIIKATEMESDIIPEVVRRLKSNMNTSFIEIATELLVRTSINVSEDVIAYYDQMRSPYAQSLVLVMLGFKASEERIPWLIEKYNSLKKAYPKENYHEGAYYGLIEMADRFYPAKLLK